MKQDSVTKHIGSGAGSQIEYDISVTDGRVYYTTENDGYRFMRSGPDQKVREITLDDLRNGHVRGQRFYEEAKAEVERQLQIMAAATQPGEA